MLLFVRILYYSVYDRALRLKALGPLPRFNCSFALGLIGSLSSVSERFRVFLGLCGRKLVEPGAEWELLVGSRVLFCLFWLFEWNVAVFAVNDCSGIWFHWF